LSLSEFALIEEYFFQRTTKRKDVHIGIGDDCAVLECPEGQRLAVTMDTLVEGIHFLPNTPAEELAWKAISVNLSDLAAMGAEPAWLSLALTLPQSNTQWLKEFSDSFFDCAAYYGLTLVGGDTTTGPLSVTIHATGFVPADTALKRSGAKPGDVICVTGTLGDAGLGLQISLGKHLTNNDENKNFLLNRLHQPSPRVAVGLALRNIATSAIDISDGLAGDLLHVLQASEVGGMIEISDLPFSEALIAETTAEEAIILALSAGDDYELCFTVAEDDLEAMDKALKITGCAYTAIGRITGGTQLKLHKNGEPVDLKLSSYEHFSQ